MFIEMEAGGASRKTINIDDIDDNIDRYERPTRASLVFSNFLVANRDTPGAIIKNAANCRDVVLWLSD